MELENDGVEAAERNYFAAWRLLVDRASECRVEETDEVLYTFVIPNMYAKAARGELSPQQSVAEAEKQINSIFQNWRSRGLVAG